MIQKVLKVGSSAAVTIPKKSLEELKLKIGDQVRVNIDRVSRSVRIEPAVKVSKRAERITKLGLDFVDRYRTDLENLAKK